MSSQRRPVKTQVAFGNWPHIAWKAAALKVVALQDQLVMSL